MRPNESSHHDTKGCIEMTVPAPTASVLRGFVRAFGLGLAAVALAAGSVAASTDGPLDPGRISQAIGPASTKVTSTLHNVNHVSVSSVSVGSYVHPSFTVTSTSGTPTGSARIRVYDTGDCSGAASTTFDLVLPMSAAVDSAAYRMTSSVPASRSIQVSYLGSAAYVASSAPCQKVTFTKAVPKITLAIHAAEHQVVTSVPFTSTVHAAAAVSGSAGVPTNWVLVRSWANDSCSGTDYVHATKYLDATGHVDDLLPVGFSGAGPRSFMARYSGDGAYIGVWTECIAVNGTKVAPSFGFELHDAAHDAVPSTVLVKTPIHPAFTLTGAGIQPTGTVTVRQFQADDCQGSSFSFSAPAAATFDDPSFARAAPTSPGSVSWRAFYPGDANYGAVSGPCVSVRFKAPSTTPKPSTTPAPAVTPTPSTAPTPASTADPSPAPTSDVPAVTATPPGQSGAATGAPDAAVGSPRPTDDAVVAGPVAGSGGTGAGDEGPGWPLWLLLLIGIAAGASVGFAVARRGSRPQVETIPLAPASSR
jgi:hypothetical protein